MVGGIGSPGVKWQVEDGGLRIEDGDKIPGVIDDFEDTNAVVPGVRSPGLSVTVARREAGS